MTGMQKIKAAIGKADLISLTTPAFRTVHHAIKWHQFGFPNHQVMVMQGGNQLIGVNDRRADFTDHDARRNIGNPRRIRKARSRRNRRCKAGNNRIPGP